MTVAPAMSTARLRPDLAETLEEFDTELHERGYVADQVLPIFTVGQQTANFYKIELAEWKRKQGDLKRASGGAYARRDMLTAQDNYATQEYGEEAPVDDRNKAIYDDYFDAEVVSTRMARHDLMTAYEQRVADLVQSTANVGGNAAASTAWSNTTTGTVLEDTKAAMLAVKDQCGEIADTMLVTVETFFAIRDNESILDRIKYHGGDDPKRMGLTPAVLAQALGLKEVIVAGGVTNSATQGQAVSLTNIWSSANVLVFRRAPNQADFSAPVFGRTMHWDQDGSSPRGTVEQYRDEVSRADIIRVRHDVDEKILFPEAAYLITGAYS